MTTSTHSDSEEIGLGQAISEIWYGMEQCPHDNCPMKHNTIHNLGAFEAVVQALITKEKNKARLDELKRYDGVPYSVGGVTRNNYLIDRMTELKSAINEERGL